MSVAVLAFALAAAQAPSGYRLAWSDEFDRDGRPDPANWNYEHGFVRNKELQWYRPENARVEKGLLVIEGKRERVENPHYDAKSDDWRKNRPYAEYTASSLRTMGLREFQYGRFEIRAKIDARKGLWPAIWTLGAKGGWPQGGEVDLLEYYDDSLLANTVYGTGQGIWDTGKVPLKEFTDRDPDWASKFHVWRMEWDERAIRLYVDERLLNETDITGTKNPDGSNPFHQPHYILLNLAIGSNGGDPSKTEFPTRYEVDYVRVYQKA